MANVHYVTPRTGGKVNSDAKASTLFSLIYRLTTIDLVALRKSFEVGHVWNLQMRQTSVVTTPQIRESLHETSHLFRDNR